MPWKQNKRKLKRAAALVAAVALAVIVYRMDFEDWHKLSRLIGSLLCCGLCLGGLILYEFAMRLNRRRYW